MTRKRFAAVRRRQMAKRSISAGGFAALLRSVPVLHFAAVQVLVKVVRVFSIIRGDTLGTFRARVVNSANDPLNRPSR